MKYLIIIILFSLPSLKANESTKERKLERQRVLQTPNPKSLQSGEIKDYKEVYLFNESLIRDETKAGYLTSEYFTGKDKYRAMIGYQFSPDYNDINAISTIELGFQFKTRGITDLWYSFLLKRTTANYDIIADPISSSSGNTNADANTDRLDSIQNFTSLGLGAAFRFRALSDLIKNDRWFETVASHLTYTTHLDNSTSKEYNGYGLIMDYTLLYRMNNSFYTGAKISYNIQVVERDAIDDEKKEDRSLVFGWTALGLEFGYYY